MDSNHKEQCRQQDHTLKNKMLALQEQDYDTRKGWHALAGQLAAYHKPVRKQPKGKIFFIWKMTVAAMLLLLIGFFTGRLSSEHDFPPQQTTAVRPSPNDQPAAQTNSAAPKATASGAEAAVTDKIAVTADKQRTEKKAIAPQHKRAAGNQKYYAKKHAAQQKTYQNHPTGTERSIVRHDTLSSGKDSRYALNGVNIIPDETARPSVKADVHSIRTSPHISSDKSLPVVSLSEINTLPSLPPTQPELYRNGLLKESVYKKLGNNSGTSSNNPFRIRF